MRIAKGLRQLAPMAAEHLFVRVQALSVGSV